jgi:hypothetical protein
MIYKKKCDACDKIIDPFYEFVYGVYACSYRCLKIIDKKTSTIKV